MKRIFKRMAVLALLLCMVCTWALAEPAKISVAFPGTVGGAQLAQETEIDFDWFDEPSDRYDHRLAKLSISMAVAAFRDGKVNLRDSNHYLLSFFNIAGFDGWKTYGYRERPTKDTISNGIAWKNLSDEKGEYVLLAVPVCGQGYGDEWLSNFSVDDGENHSGFLQAAQMVYDRINECIEEEGFTGKRIKFWGTGFSRAAAVSNMLADMLLRDERFEQNDIFYYTFGTPNTTKDPVAWPQIHNICGSFDPVPRIPFADWGFGKHGITYYLPALETDDLYKQVRGDARSVYTELMGKDDKSFDSLPDRNWLICRLLEILYETVPESKAYSQGMQDAVIAAWSTPGTVLDKLNAMQEKLNLQGENTEALDQVIEEVTMLIGAGVSDTVNAMIGTGGSSSWYDLLSSGVMLAHEHFPEIYLSWIYSTDDTELLYGQGGSYNRLIFMGNLDVKIIEGDKVLMDGGQSSLAVTHLRDQTFISMPVGKEYNVTLTARDATQVRIGFGCASVNRASMPVMTTNSITMYKDEFITLHVPAELGEHEKPVVLVNNEQEIALYDGEKGGNYRKLMMGNTDGVAGEILYMINSALATIPWIICSVVLLLYALVILIKRLVRHKINDYALCRLPGKVMLITAAVLALLHAGLIMIELVLTIMHSGVVQTSNRTLQRASQILGWSTNVYTASLVVIFVVVAMLSLRSIRHQLSRIRLVRLSFALVIMNTITLFLGLVFGTLAWTELVSMLIPILALLGVVLGANRADRNRMVGRHWLPVSRAVFWTMLIFFVRQAYVFLEETTVTTPAVVMKALSGLPVLILAIHMWRKRGTNLNRCTMIAIACYFTANTIINLSMPLALCAYTLGHCMLIYAYIREHKPGHIRLIVWAAVAAMLEIDLFLMAGGLNVAAKIVAVFYIAALVGVLVTGERVSKRIQLGTILFMLSNQILGITLRYPGDFLLESTELLLYYIAVIILAMDPKALMQDIPVEKKPEAEQA